MIDIGERAGSGIPGVFSVWHKTFGASPEYSQRTSPDRITTTLILADYLDGFADNPVEKTGKTVEKSKGLIRRIGLDKGGHWEVISKNFD